MTLYLWDAAVLCMATKALCLSALMPCSLTKIIRRTTFGKGTSQRRFVLLISRGVFTSNQTGQNSEGLNCILSNKKCLFSLQNILLQCTLRKILQGCFLYNVNNTTYHPAVGLLGVDWLHERKDFWYVVDIMFTLTFCMKGMVL